MRGEILQISHNVELLKNLCARIVNDFDFERYTSTER